MGRIDDQQQARLDGPLTSSAPLRAVVGFARIEIGKLDRASVLAGVGAVFVFFALGWVCLELSRFGAALASVWLPAAVATTFLLKFRFSNEVPAYAGFAAALFLVNLTAGHSAFLAAAYTLGNVAEVALVAAIIRRTCKDTFDVSDVQHLGQLLLAGGLVGPICSSLLVAALTSLSGEPSSLRILPWFMAHSMGMVLIVPTALVVLSALRAPSFPPASNIAQHGFLMAGGLLIVAAVFAQDQYPLLFLIPPITLLMAFRVGGFGTAIYVPIIAALTTVMTVNGMGPIATATAAEPAQIYLLQAFIAANFLTGLPIAAILAGRERMTDELIAGRQELALLTANVSDLVMRIDNHGICTYVSPSVAEVLGREPDGLLGQNIIEMAHKHDQHRLADMLYRMIEGDQAKERLTYQRIAQSTDEAPVFIEADAVRAVDPQTGERSGIVVSARDVTERVELELLLTRARNKAEDATQAKTEFLANMSHEIRTPMNGVLGFAELMLQGDLSEENRRHVDMIVQSGRSMMLLLNDILDLSKIEAGQISIDESPVDLFSTINECVMLHRPVAEKKGLDLTFHVPCASSESCETYCDMCESAMAHPVVMTDALRLRQIALNLIGNAVKFTEEGQVNVTCELDGGTITICVEDTGIGIDADALEKVFTPFTQAESNTARRFGGTGLGLTISRQLADLLGGSIDVESSPGVGSTFRLILPAKLVEASTTTPAEPFASQSGAPLYDYNDDQEHDEADDGAFGVDDHAAMWAEPLPVSARILLAEDHDVNRLLAVEMLERCGQSVAVAHDGNEAIAMVIESVMRDDPYDLVLMDIQMPGCDGYEATRAIRNEGIGPETMPIIALTANAFPSDINAARAAGMQGHLAKPIEFSDLARALQRWLPTRIVDAESLQESAAPPQQLAPAPRSNFRKHSPSLIKRWNIRRAEAIDAVREALESGELGAQGRAIEDFDRLARLVHKLAGTAAIFDEPELGDQAAAFERSLREDLPGDVREALAFELLSVADDPAESFAQTG
ncbi:MAG: ATP-binding protein [Pseudomonadota bacterium]